MLKVVIVIGCVAVLAILAVATIPVRLKRQAARTKCVQNLKEIDFAALQWVHDATEGYLFPWQIPTRDGGVSELVLSGDVSATFRILSNQLNGSFIHRSGDVFACPSDTERNPESDLRKVANGNVSYFLALDHLKPWDSNRDPHYDAQRCVIMFGDRNISGGILISNQIMEVRTPSALTWTKDLHLRCGNIAVSDGSIQQTEDKELRDWMAGHLGNAAVDGKAHFAMP